uniref:ARID domain-containing protein n=1 Tax=Heterorhabditis bacteriophora TaxID=37862 RepID=A0A1I7X5U0_HETBA
MSYLYALRLAPVMNIKPSDLRLIYFHYFVDLQVLFGLTLVRKWQEELRSPYSKRPLFYQCGPTKCIGKSTESVARHHT